MKLEEALNMTSHASVAVEVLQIGDDGKYALAGLYSHDDLPFSIRKKYGKCDVIAISGTIETTKPSHFDGAIQAKPIVVFTIEVE